MSILNPAARELLESAALAHMVTINPDGSPQVTCVWAGLDGDDIVSGHLLPHKKIRNLRDDSRVVVSVEAPTRNAQGLDEYLVVHGTAQIDEGGAAALLQRLAHVYLGPDVVFPPPEYAAAPGWVIRIRPERVSGMGPWRD